MPIPARVQVLSLLLALAGIVPALAESDSRPWADLEAPQHDYWNRTLRDPFSQKILDDLQSGRLPLDRSSEKAYLIGLLEALEIPASSQMLVFSTTSLQLRFISPRNPRAIYFNEDLYLGYVPGGRIEIVSLDPVAGAVFYIFDIPRDQRPAVVERSDRCMNCHAASETGHVPGLVIKSVVPGPRGGSLESFRREETGHAIPFDQRFGGWHVTGTHGIRKHWGNLIGQLSPDGLITQDIPPGERFDFSRYPVPTSDILAHLLHEHQAGFVNRVVEASYRARTYHREDGATLTPDHERELDRQAEILARYLLFADEAPLPKGGIEGDPEYMKAFLKTRKKASNGLALKDFDLRTHLFRHRCSYMIYSAVFEGLPSKFKSRVYRKLGNALREDSPAKEFAYLPISEKRAIRTILRETLPDLRTSR